MEGCIDNTIGDDLLPELNNYLLRLNDLHSQIREIIAGVPADGLNWKPFEGSGELQANSLAALTAHVVGSERYWIGEVLGGAPPSRDRDAEFRFVVSGIEELNQLLDLASTESSEVLSRFDAGDMDGIVQARGKDIPIRWVILNVIDHTSLHIGHMQMTYQLWSGGQTRNPPAWYDRLPKNKG